MSKKIIIISLFFCMVACEQDVKDAQALNASSSSDETAYSPEELLGKTVEEYQAAEQQQNKPVKDEPQPPEVIIKNGYLQLGWEELIAPGYDADSILAKYEPQIAEIEHGSESAIALYQKMQDEFNNAPANDSLAGRKVSIPGFIAPLEQNNGVIFEFLLVPYFGACIHMPAPPANQTVYIKASGDYGIKIDEAYKPVWVSGELLVENESTEIGAASYQIHNAVISPYQ